MKTWTMLPLLGRIASASLAAPAALFCVASLSTTLVGCADEDDPNTWVKRLDDPAQRTPAIKRLGEFYNDAINKAPDKSKAKDDPKVKAVLDVIVEPLTKQYVTGNLDDKTRRELMKNLADMADPRASPAFAKAFSDYEPGKNDDDVKFAAQASTSLAKQGKLADQQSLVDALWACFAKFQPSKAKSINLVTDLRDAIITVKHPSWGPKAVEKLGGPAEPAMDQIEFWQATSARLIGLLKFTAGVKPLVTALLTPAKKGLAGTIRLALLRMPKESEAALVGAAKGTDADTGALFKAYPEGAGIVMLSEPLAYLSRPATEGVLLDTLAGTDDDTIQTIVALNLVHFPSTDPNVEKTFLATYNKIDPSTVVALGGGNGRGVLLSASTHFYDPNLTDWMMKEVASAKGDSADAIQAAALLAAIRIMPNAKKDAVNAAVNKVAGSGPATEKDQFKAAATVLDKCKEDAACYVSFLDQPIPSGMDPAKTAFIKACFMAGVYGNDKTRADLVAKLDKIKDNSVRLSMVEAVEHLTPKGDIATADALDKIVDADTASGNKTMAPADDAVSKVALILRSRATP